MLEGTMLGLGAGELRKWWVTSIRLGEVVGYSRISVECKEKDECLSQMVTARGL